VEIIRYNVTGLRRMVGEGSGAKWATIQLILGDGNAN